MRLVSLATPPGDFDPARYFRADGPIAFLNVRTPVVRALAREIAHARRDTWQVDDALAFAGLCMRDAHFEVKGVGVELLARYRRAFTPAHLPAWRQWLAGNLASNWATTDSICGALIAPLLLAHPELVTEIASWVNDPNLWVRRASAVSLVKLASRGRALDAAYGVATALQPDPHDLIQKAAGWLLREAGKTDRVRLERYLRDQGPRVPRTTVRYAVEHFPEASRQRLLVVTRGGRTA